MEEKCQDEIKEENTFIEKLSDAALISMRNFLKENPQYHSAFTTNGSILPEIWCHAYCRGSLEVNIQ